ncbi:Crp/Fnr family transcriptional regulator [Arundinibacter roseus]|uniref:Crp/Fnr family transcriptional regulator n=1 Tax=Arundinibacter roseus TaxID=2070510 RepID=A0A4R4KEB0_9BACT|nr:Crp/Fnr family transcriptional regulator [Arundinibacter roseus]TDB66053.1 Crp/Fnr family transcriptional regulator [Arundinibacter roseus]
MKLLKEFLSRYITLSDPQFENLGNSLREMHLQEGDYLLREGNICRTIGFVTQGTLRVLHFDQDGEVTRYFIPKGAIAVLPDSFRYQAPANENIQAVTDCRLWILRYEDLIKMYDQIPMWTRLVQKLLEEVQHQRALGRRLNMQDVRTRLQLFNEEYPGLAQEIPIKTLASFLRISPLELTKIRSEMAQ